MFNIIYAKSVTKDLKKITKQVLPQIKKEIKELKKFPVLSNLKHLNNHPLADYRLRIGNYRVLFDINWTKNSINLIV